jgi:hypothetical protein
LIRRSTLLEKDRKEKEGRTVIKGEEGEGGVQVIKQRREVARFW